MDMNVKKVTGEGILPLQAGEAPTEQERKFAETQRIRVGFDIDDVLVRCKIAHDYRADPASYDRLPLLAVFEALAIDPSFEIHIITGRRSDTVPQEISEWVAAMKPGCQMTLVCREWDHPVDRLTLEDKARKNKYHEHPLCKDVMDDYFGEYLKWKGHVVAALKLDVYFDDQEFESATYGVRYLARQFCHVR